MAGGRAAGPARGTEVSATPSRGQWAGGGRWHQVPPSPRVPGAWWAAPAPDAALTPRATTVLGPAGAAVAGAASRTHAAAASAETATARRGRDTAGTVERPCSGLQKVHPTPGRHHPIRDTSHPGRIAPGTPEPSPGVPRGDGLPQRAGWTSDGEIRRHL